MRIRLPFVRRSTYEREARDALKRRIELREVNIERARRIDELLTRVRNLEIGKQAQADAIEEYKAANRRYLAVVREDKDGRFRVGIVDADSYKGVWNMAGHSFDDMSEAFDLARTLPFECFTDSELDAMSVFS